MKTLHNVIAGLGIAALLALAGCSSQPDYSGIYTSIDNSKAAPELARVELHVARDGSFKGSMVLLAYETFYSSHKNVEVHSVPVEGNIQENRIHMVIKGTQDAAAEGTIGPDKIEMTVPMKGTFNRSTQAEYQAVVKKLFGKNAPDV